MLPPPAPDTGGAPAVSPAVVTVPAEAEQSAGAAGATSPVSTVVTPSTTLPAPAKPHATTAPPRPREQPRPAVDVLMGLAQPFHGSDSLTDHDVARIDGIIWNLPLVER